MSSSLSEHDVERIRAAILAGRKMEAIKLYRQSTGEGLKEAKDFIESLESQLWSRPKNIGDDRWIRLLLPVGRSGWAIAAGYLGLASVLCFPAALFAILSGILAIREMRRDPKRHGMGRAVFGIIMGAISTAVHVLALAAFVASVVKGR